MIPFACSILWEVVMLGIGDTTRRVVRRLSGARGRARLYRPDPADLDIVRHIDEALAWLRRAQDAGGDPGVAYGVVFDDDFDVSYPETTGYICQTFVREGRARPDEDLLHRAVAMADWEADIQLSSGAVMGGKVNTRPTPAVFNTGMVLLGWSEVVRLRHDPRHEDATRSAAEWLLSVQDRDGGWRQGNSRYAVSGATLYNVMAAWGLCEAGLALGDRRFVDAAVRNGEYCVSQQHPNGWLPNCCLTKPSAPLLHTLAYAMQGMLEIGKLTDRDDLVDGARRLADTLLRMMPPDGCIPGRLRPDLSSGASWTCLTGTAQTSIVWSELFLLTQDERYLRAASAANRYLMARHDIRNADERLRGGLPGSWPVWGDYGPLQILNWATKFLVDALALEQRIVDA
jgi:hypothetical protein